MRTLGPYRIITGLGRGGMGDVYEAALQRPDGFHKTYAVKVVDLSGDALQVSLPSLLNEAVTGARFNHPNLVHIHDYGFEHQGERHVGYIVMDYVDGWTFRQLIDDARARGEPLDEAVVLELVIPVAEALRYAWSEARDSSGQPIRMIHRDIKPTNLMVSRHGVVKLLDLGIVRAATNPNPTIIQAIKGTVPYMSPEQASNRSLDCRTDIFSLGAVAFELAMLGRLYVGDGDDLLGRVRSAETAPRLAALAARSPQLASTLQGALAPEPSERFPNPEAFLSALRALQRRLPRGRSLAAHLIPLNLDAQPTDPLGPQNPAPELKAGNPATEPLLSGHWGPPLNQESPPSQRPHLVAWVVIALIIASLMTLLYALS